MRRKALTERIRYGLYTAGWEIRKYVLIMIILAIEVYLLSSIPEIKDIMIAAKAAVAFI